MIEKIFEELRDIGVVRTRDQFSAEWLGRERSYLRGLQSKKRQPSVDVLVTCAARLVKSAEQFSKADAPMAKAKSAELRRLADSCFSEILDVGLRR